MNSGYIARRAVYAFVTFLIVLVLNFVIPRLMPGSPVQYFANPKILPSIEAHLLTQRFGLDKPVWDQFLLYVVGVFRWPPDLGVSYMFYPTPVWNVVMAYLPWTVLLVGTSTLVTAVIGILVGIWVGAKKGTKTDTVVTSISLFFWTMPFFWLGAILLWFFSIYLRVFPAGGAFSLDLASQSLPSQMVDIASHAFLPGLTLTLAAFAGYSLIMRNTIVMLPMVTLVGLNLGYVVSGALLVEVVFSYPGVGWLTYQAVLSHDYPLLQGLFLVLSVAVILANFLADIIYTFIDPRIR
jgi:peptide/nickel transport system permease protein